jgi:hypothetical protein
VRDSPLTLFGGKLAPGIVDPGEIHGTAEFGPDYSARDAKKHRTAAILKKDAI